MFISVYVKRPARSKHQGDDTCGARQPPATLQHTRKRTARSPRLRTLLELQQYIPPRLIIIEEVDVVDDQDKGLMSPGVHAEGNLLEFVEG